MCSIQQVGTIEIHEMRRNAFAIVEMTDVIKRETKKFRNLEKIDHSADGRASAEQTFSKSPPLTFLIRDTDRPVRHLV